MILVFSLLTFGTANFIKIGFFKSHVISGFEDKIKNIFQNKKICLDESLRELTKLTGATLGFYSHSDR